MKTKPALPLIAVTIFININTICAQAVDVQDSLALVDLYNSTDGPGWYYNTNWLTGIVKTWYGVTVKNGRVTKIDLYGNNLSGTLPSSIGDLAKVDTLLLGSNFELGGSIPPEVNNLENLRYLDLSFNNFSGSIPSSIGNLSKLLFLRLNYNQLSGIIPPSIGSLNSLDTLDLSGNNLSGSIPGELGNLASLEYLELSFNELSGGIPHELGNLTNLLFLDAGFNKLSGAIPPVLGNLVNLQFLDFYDNQLSSAIPPELGNLANLQYLLLVSNQLSGAIPQELGNLANLTHLELNHNLLSGNIPAELGNLANLVHLILSENMLSGSIPAELGKLTNLYDLGLNQNRLSGSIPPELGNLVNLDYCSLTSNQLSGAIPQELGNLINVEWLSLDTNQLTGSIPPELGNLADTLNLRLNNNRLSGPLPAELGNLNVNSSIFLSNNLFTFDGMEPIVQKFEYATYAPQEKIHLHQNDSSLSVYAGGTLSNNTYRWFMVGKTGSATIKGDSVFQPTDHGRYYAQVTNSICTDLTLYTDTVEYLGVLPVTIINLRAYRQGKQNKIEWTGATEINVDKYEIQRASNALDFITIGHTKAIGNGTEKTEYSFTDAKPLTGNNYYRLKIFDEDGKITYSNIVLVNMNTHINTRVYPVPANQILHVETYYNTPFSMLDQAGRILFTIDVNGKGTIDVSRLSAGTYFLRDNNTGSVQKVIIAR